MSKYASSIRKVWKYNAITIEIYKKMCHKYTRHAMIIVSLLQLNYN